MKKVVKHTLLAMLAFIAAAAVIFTALMLIFYWFPLYGIPGKAAIKESDFNSYEPYIIVREVHYSGGIWVQAGDENGYFAEEDYIDIDLANRSILPSMFMYDEDYVNQFLCKVEYRGKVENDMLGQEVDSYEVVEWYPIYPVKRDMLFFHWLSPKSYLSKYEIEENSY